MSICFFQAEYGIRDLVRSRGLGDVYKRQEILDFKFFYTIANLPSPMEMINAIYQNEVPFNKEMLNSPSNEEKYNTAYKKAVNYGIYGIDMAYACLLYTSDAADERSSVDLGGRRIIKKKNIDYINVVYIKYKKKTITARKRTEDTQ